MYRVLIVDDEKMIRMGMKNAIDWKKLGVDVKLEAMEYEVYVDERRNGKLQMARMQWYAHYNDPTSWLKMYQTGNAQNDVKPTMTVFTIQAM